jgi:hypothetical protein
MSSTCLLNYRHVLNMSVVVLTRTNTQSKTTVVKPKTVRRCAACFGQATPLVTPKLGILPNMYPCLKARQDLLERVKHRLASCPFRKQDVVQ